MKGTSSEVGRALQAALYRIFRAVARVALRRGVAYPAVADIAKRAFVDVAYEELTLPGRKQTASRVAVLTGIHRKDVARMLGRALLDDREASERVTAAASVVAGWRRDKHFADGRGMPAALPFEGGAASFSALVRRYGTGDVPARAVLDELIRVEAATRQRDGRIRLTADAYLPEAASPEALAIFGSDVADLVSTIDHNLAAKPGEGFFQRKVAYDNVPLDSVQEIRRRVEHEGQALLEKLDRAIAKHDRDSNPKVGGSGRKRVMVGVYYFESDPEEGSS